MQASQSKRKESSEAFRRFDRQATQVIAVPKAEIDKREAEWKRERLVQKRQKSRH